MSLEMMPKLFAEESMRAVERAGISFGTLEKDLARRIMKGWQRDVGTAAQKLTKATAGRDLGNMGIGYTVVEKHGD
jgi:hypothetical protein